MKALLQSNVGNKEAAMELAKLGVRHNLRSQFCWHVYGCVREPACLVFVEGREWNAWSSPGGTGQECGWTVQPSKGAWGWARGG